jgi:hypothetical protein
MGLTVEQRLPAVELTDGRGGTQIRVAFLDEQAWNQLAGTILPPISEPGRSIVFPPLPSV